MRVTRVLFIVIAILLINPSLSTDQVIPITDYGVSLNVTQKIATFIDDCWESNKTDIDLSKIATGLWFPSVFYSYAKERYLTPFFNPLSSLKCLTFWISYEKTQRVLTIQFRCNNEIRRNSSCSDFSFNFTKSGLKYSADPDQQYNCNSKLQSPNVTIITTDYQNYIAIYGCKNIHDFRSHVDGLWILVRNVTKTQANDTTLMNFRENNYNLVLDVENYNSDNFTGVCNCSEMCLYQVCQIDEKLVIYNIIPEKFKILEAILPDLEKLFNRRVTPVEIGAIFIILTIAISFIFLLTENLDYNRVDWKSISL